MHACVTVEGQAWILSCSTCKAGAMLSFVLYSMLKALVQGRLTES